ncbi:DUF2309 domain-containing protein [Singulisphaera sp. PoT]|uniref:DUF2309 domain-containing protein n=1 Tax=Singulisphaera sp. PoT TaxID=3411797 RepID=UPI003BF47B0C
MESQACTAGEDVDAGRGPRHSTLEEAIEEAAHLLPAQGPIAVFIHHNTLHAFEHLPFHEGVKEGGRALGCHPYATEDFYRDAVRRGRIRFSEIQEALEQDLGESAKVAVPGFSTRLDLRLAMLQYPTWTGPTEELIWHVSRAKAMRRVRQEASSAIRSRLIAETRRWVMRDLRGGVDPTTDGMTTRGMWDSLRELLRRFDAGTIEGWGDAKWEEFTLQALWRVCCEGVRDLPPSPPASPGPIRHRDLLLEASGADADLPVHELLIRSCAAYLDQGFSRWPMPGRERGFYQAFCSLHRQASAQPDRWRRGLGRELGRLQDRGMGPLDSIRESLEVLGVVEEEWGPFIAETLLALRGWGGMVRQVEIRRDMAVHPIPAGSLVDFLAIRLILDRFSLAAMAADALGYEGPLAGLRDAARGRIDGQRPPSVEQRAFPVFQLAQVVGLSPDVLRRLEQAEWAGIVEEVEAFSGLERRRLFHLAYERRLCTQALDALALHAGRAGGGAREPRFQLVCCIDEREESFRRHLEEVEPGAETFGVAGFFGVAMYYKGVSDAHFVPLCPGAIRPGHRVVEEAGDGLSQSHRRRARTRKALGTVSHLFHIGSRDFALGALLTGAVGVLASIPLVARILFPRLTSRIRMTFGRFVRPSPRTRLGLGRREDGHDPGAPASGFAIEEMVDIGERVLQDIGMTSGFARVVILLGHGSSSQNNPHNSAYNCGACGGAAGGPNARALAQMLNDPRVREGLAARGLALPEDSVFVGGLHNTCSESVTFYDLSLIPESHRADFRAAREAVEEACERNAHERCRRFMSAPLTLSPSAARRHVEERSEDLAQTRPELGHATNAITVVGRRRRSRGLFLDRRAFLVSYDPTLDAEGSPILTRILQAVIPVCSGIGLEYYFSNVDNAGFGAGTKLPHNLASLLGVMDGSASDLRTGLPWQMVEIHEPVRPLFLVEATPAAMLGIIRRDESIGRLCRNEWILLAVLDPETRAIHIFRGGEFRPYRPQAPALPRAASSLDWYRGWRDHLEFAEIAGQSSSDQNKTHDRLS